MRRAFPLAAVVALAACAPTPEQVAARCETEVRQTTGLTGTFGMGVASGRGLVNESEIGFTAGVTLGGAPDPRTAYETCVRRRSGQGPVRPFAGG